jgi:hypothetical protein
MRTAAVALLFAQGLDAATLLAAFALFPDPLVEANPVATLLMSRYGLLVTAFMKLGIVILLALWGVTTTTRYRRVGTALLAAGAVSGTVGAATNLLVITALIGVS